MIRHIIRSPATLLEEDWIFVPSFVPLRTRVLRLQHRLTARLPAPAWRIVRAPAAYPRWNLLFLFLRGGTIDPAQREILRRVRGLSGRLLVVFAAPPGTIMPDEIEVADAIVHKDLEGFDFSGYAIGLTLLARHAPGADVYVQNDSVLGPFADIDALVDRARWDLTGFMASVAVENHISSFAFILKDVTPHRMASLSDVLSPCWCYNNFDAVVLSQETRFARVAHRTMSVGALFRLPAGPAPRNWRHRIAGRISPASVAHLPHDLRGDATLGSPLELLDRGFPFLKRSLFGKFEGVADRGGVSKRLAALGWPQDAL